MYKITKIRLIEISLQEILTDKEAIAHTMQGNLLVHSL